MSLARRVCKGTTYLLSRRTTRRYFLFRPDADRKVEGIFWYCLAVAAKRHGILVHGAILMSNHIHAVVTDVEGVVPAFLHDFHRTLACATKAHRGWPGEVFDKNQTSTVQLLTPEALVSELAYVIANGPLSGLVRYAREWPGALTRVDDIGKRTIRAKRPATWFDARNEQWLEEVELAIVMPEVLMEAYGSAELAREAIAVEVRRLERKARGEAERRARSFLGAERACRAAITRRGTKWELFGSRNPTFAAGGDAHVARAAVDELRAFRAAYREALARWCAGAREVLFPFGTWWMRVHHDARCEPPPAPS